MYFILKKIRFSQKIISFVLSFLLVFQSLVPSLSLAQESTTSAEPVTISEFTSPPVVDENLTETSSASAQIDVSTNSDQQSATVAPSIWKSNDDVSSTTVSLVTLNTTYKAPQNDKVTVTFTKLPESSGQLTIKEVKLSKEEQESIGAFSDTAYDITSTMQDGTFTYDLTLPLPTEAKDKDVEVKAGENVDELDLAETVNEPKEKTSDTIKITGLNHFTVFVVAGTVNGNTATVFDESNASVLINEFVVDPAGNEWVELYNNTSSSIDLSGWKLEDNNSLTTDDIDLSGAILAGGFLVFENSANWLNNPNGNNQGDTIALKNSNSEVVDKVTYIKKTGSTVVTNADDLRVTDISEDQSIGRTADGVISGDIWTKYSEVTKGYNNLGNITFLNVGSIYPFEGIRQALNQINAGGTINVAAGEYDENSIEITTPGVRIIGPGVSKGIKRAVISTSDCEDKFDLSDSLFHLHANNIVLQGLEIDPDRNCDHAVHIGDFSEIQVSGVEVSGNVIHGASYGVTISWGSTNNSASPNIVSGNEIHNNDVAGILLNSASNNKISSNWIHNNSDSGIKLIDCLENGVGNCGASAPSGNFITGNTIENNGEEVTDRTGIHIFNGGVGNVANQNIISGNILGVTNNDGRNVLDATRNFWGGALGPFHQTDNPNGVGNNGVGDNVLYRPFYTDIGRETLSTSSVDPEDLENLLETGTFSISDDEDEVSVNENVTISVSDNGGTSSVILPTGTTITRTDGGDIDVSDLTTDDVTESSLTGLASGTVIDGALKWGLDNVELNFNPAITLNIFVGTAFNGQILNVQRSTSGTGGWTTEGIGPPTTCTVAVGICTFTATKASNYAATHTTASTTSSTSTSSSSSSDGGVSTPSCTDAAAGGTPTLLSATAAGLNQVTLTWTKVADPVTNFVVVYGLSAGNPLYGNPNVGDKNTTNYIVSGLSGKTAYYFKVRAGNGCNAGGYSNELSVTPGGAVISSPAVGFTEGVLGESTPTTGEELSGEVKSATSSTSGEQLEADKNPTQSQDNRNKTILIIVIILGLVVGGIFLRKLF